MKKKAPQTECGVEIASIYNRFLGGGVNFVPSP